MKLNNDPRTNPTVTLAVDATYGYCVDPDTTVFPPFDGKRTAPMRTFDDVQDAIIWIVAGFPN